MKKSFFGILAMSVSMVTQTDAATLTCGVTTDDDKINIHYLYDSVVKSEVVNNQASLIINQGIYSYGIGLYRGKLNVSTTDGNGNSQNFDFGAPTSNPLVISSFQSVGPSGGPANREFIICTVR